MQCMDEWQGVALDSMDSMPYSSTPCGQATPEMGLQLFQGWPTHTAGSLQPSYTPFDTPRHTPMCMIEKW
jgi:hypothetical protein